MKEVDAADPLPLVIAVFVICLVVVAAGYVLAWWLDRRDAQRLAQEDERRVGFSRGPIIDEVDWSLVDPSTLASIEQTQRLAQVHRWINEHEVKP